MDQFFDNIAKKKQIDESNFKIYWQMISCWFMLLKLYLTLLDICGFYQIVNIC